MRGPKRAPRPVLPSRAVTGPPEDPYCTDCGEFLPGDPSWGEQWRGTEYMYADKRICEACFGKHYQERDGATKEVLPK